MTKHFFARLINESETRRLRFLVIGGHAVNVYGYSRETADVDLLIPTKDRRAWEELLATMRYSLYHDGGPFLQFSSPEEHAWPIDLMIVKDETFEKMYCERQSLSYEGNSIPIPEIKHLIALKVHALNHSHIGRFLKDFQDVTGLIQCGKLNVESEEVRSIFQKHGTKDLYEKIRRALN